MRWHYRDPALLWLFVPAYALHIAEETWAGPGFPAWFRLVAGGPLPVPAFAAINTIAFGALLAGIRAATRREASGWIAVAVATIAVVNGLLHLAASVWTGTYSPGLITGIVLYGPLGQLTLLRAWHQQAPHAFARGLAAGLLLHAAASAAAWGAAA